MTKFLPSRICIVFLKLEIPALKFCFKKIAKKFCLKNLLYKKLLKKFYSKFFLKIFYNWAVCFRSDLGAKLKISS